MSEKCARLMGGGQFVSDATNKLKIRKLLGAGRREVQYRTGTGTLAKNSVASYHQRKK